MGKAIPTQHPAVVLRSHYKQLRALLAVAMIAVAGLTAAVVILANDSDKVSSTSSAKPIESINYGDSNYVNPSTGYPSATSRPESAGSIHPDRPSAGTSSTRAQDLRHLRAGGVTRQPNVAPGTRYDGGPEEGSAEVTPAQPKVTQQQAFPGLAPQASIGSGTAAKDEAATSAAPGQSSDGTVTRGSKTDPHGPASLRHAP
jgi:hypothetical protein